PKEKETPVQANCTKHVFICVDTCAHSDATPRVELPSQFGIVFNEQNRNRDHHIGASLHQPYYRFFGIRFRKDDKHHDRMTKDFDPPLESHKWKIRPCDGDETVKQKSNKPSVVLNNF